MIIQTTKGPIDEAELDRDDIVRVDTDRVFGHEHRFRLKGQAEVVAVMTEVTTWKFDRLTEVTALMPDGAHGIMKLADLDATFGCVDNENEYSWWIEYRLKGTDKIVSRQAHVTLKKPPEAASGEAGRFGQ